MKAERVGVAGGRRLLFEFLVRLTTVTKHKAALQASLGMTHEQCKKQESERFRNAQGKAEFALPTLKATSSNNNNNYEVKSSRVESSRAEYNKDRSLYLAFCV